MPLLYCCTVRCIFVVCLLNSLPMFRWVCLYPNTSIVYQSVWGCMYQWHTPITFQYTRPCWTSIDWLVEIGEKKSNQIVLWNMVGQFTSKTNKTTFLWNVQTTNTLKCFRFWVSIKKTDQHCLFSLFPVDGVRLKKEKQKSVIWLIYDYCQGNCRSNWICVCVCHKQKNEWLPLSKACWKRKAEKHHWSVIFSALVVLTFDNT